jgi:hypothetical protein
MDAIRYIKTKIIFGVLQNNLRIDFKNSGTLYYAYYGYWKSRLHLRGVAHFSIARKAKKSAAEPRMRILPESFTNMNISASSMAVYQQPYQQILQ